MEAANASVRTILTDIVTEVNNRISDLNISTVPIVTYNGMISTLEQELRSRKNYKKTDFNSPLAET
jgi:hypothetical protein